MLNKFFNGILLLTALVLSGCSSNPFLTREVPPDDAKVIVVEFSDFNCPACRAASQLAQKIKNIPNLYFEFRHFPLPLQGHDTSEAAANVFECAREQNFGEQMEIALFENQGSLNEKLFLEIPGLYSFGEEFDATEFGQCVAENRYASLVQQDKKTALGAGINFTPAFVVDGAIISGNELITKVQAAFAKKEE